MRGILELESAAVQLEDSPHDLQTKPHRRAPCIEQRGRKQSVADVRREARTVVAHAHLDAAGDRAQRNTDLAVGRRVPDRVA
jgi:hypothetical protein